MTAAPAVATAMLTAAAFVPRGRTGRDRWRELTTVAAATASEQVSPLRPRWLVVGVGAVGGVGWAIGGVAVALVASGLAALRSSGCVGCSPSAPRSAPRTAPSSPAVGSCSPPAWRRACPVAGAVLATATPLTGAAGSGMRRVAGLLELGADPVDAWRTVEHRQALAAFARAAARSAGTGAALARVARTECARLRAELTDAAQARAQRAAVLITGPLGLCFLPAFLVLGIAPVVIGLAGEALARW